MRTRDRRTARASTARAKHAVGILLLGLALAPAAARAENWLLVPMDLVQHNHLRAYGVAFHTLQAGDKVDW